MIGSRTGPLLLALLFSATLQAGNESGQCPGQQAVATAHPIATQAAHSVLDAGGNAFDAAIAAAATLGVVEPYGSGLGGGGFFLLRKAGDTSPHYIFLDARETAPALAHRDLYRDAEGEVQRDPALNGALAAAIPGTPAALVHLAERHGRLPLSQSLAPAIAAAEAGFEVTERYRLLGGFRLAAMQRDAETARLFLDAGELPAVGHLIRQPELAATLRALAERGREGFYAGPVAERLLTTVEQAGGIWQQADFDSYQVIEREPVRFSLPRHEVISAPLPSAGGIALAGILQGMHALPRTEPGSASWMHQLAELMRRTYRDRAVLLGDGDFVEVPLARLVSREYATSLAGEVDPQRATPSAELGYPVGFGEGDNTTHFSLIDAEGNAVAATLSINLPFGAAFTVPGTGVILNNEMDDFAADPEGRNEYGLAGGEANAIAPAKRPLSSMTPTMLENADELAILGTPGGSRIITMVVLGALEAIAGEPVERWVSRPRFHHQYLPDRIQVEDDAFDAGLKQALETLGHRVEPAGREYGDMQALHWNKTRNELSAASDPRGVGQAEVRTPLRAE
jgi:gamma-glutamyltranspeptidase / glutathione hydrolase